MTKPKDIRTTQLNLPPGMINLGIGQPGEKLLPLDILKRASEDKLGGSDPSFLAYGAEQGDGYFRISLAEFLSARYGKPIRPEQLLITTGASLGLDLIYTLFTTAGDTIFVEEPSYFLALRIFKDHCLKVVGLPMDDNGLDIDVLEKELARHRPALLYTIPTFHNPSGVTLSDERRRRLVELSRKHGFPVVADEVYQMLAYGEAPPPPLACYPEAENILSLGSFSKILAPGLRLGWIQTGPAFMERLVGCGLLDSGGGLNPFTSAIVARALERGLQAGHLDRLKKTYSARMATLDNALRHHFGDHASWINPGGGFFIWVGFPTGIDTRAMLPAARKEDTGFQPGTNFSSRNAQQNYMRLCFAFFSDARLEEGVQRLATVFGPHLKQGG